MIYRHISSALTAIYLLVLFLVWLAGWAPAVINGLPPLTLWWSSGLLLLALTCLLASPYLAGLNDAAQVICPSFGLLGTITGMIIAFKHLGISDEGVSEGIAVLMASTWMGIAGMIALVIQGWLLRRASA